MLRWLAVITISVVLGCIVGVLLIMLQILLHASA